MRMKQNSDNVGFSRTRNFLRLWSAVAQRMFPFMMEELGELDDIARLFVMLCESVVKPEDFDYAKWNGIGRPKTSRTAVFKAFLFKALYDIPTTKELVRRLRHDVLARRLCGWNSVGDVPSEGQFSVVNKEFAERGFAEKWFGDYVRTYVEGDSCATVSYDSAPISVRAKAENARRMLEEIDPDQPEPPNRLEWQIGKDADTALAELPQNCDWGVKRDSHGKPKHWKGGKIHAAVTRDGIPVAVAYTSASLHDSQVMIPLVKKATERMEHGFDLADAAYDAETIREASAEEGNVAVIDANSRRGEQRHMTDTEREVYRDRGSDERFFSHLLDAHGGRHVRVRAPKKVLQHLLYGVLVIAVEQTMRVLC